MAEINSMPTNPMFQDLTGRTFGWLLVVSYAGRVHKGKVRWLCRCYCGRETLVGSAPLNNGNTKSCGCWGRFRPQKFWEKVLKSKHGCWEWLGHKTGRKGNYYGNMVVDGKKTLAHRLAYELTFGPIPKGLFVCHHCDNPICVRPDHLFVGTALDNSRDMISKGRGAVGPHPWCAKLTVEKVREIRDRLGKGSVNKSQICRDYGIKMASLHKIERGKTWKYA